VILVVLEIKLARRNTDIHVKRVSQR